MEQIPYLRVYGIDALQIIYHISHRVWNMEYGIGIMISINIVDHLVAKRNLIHPRRQEREKITHTKTALQVDSPPDKMSCTIPRNKTQQDIETKEKKTQTSSSSVDSQPTRMRFSAA